MIKHTIVYNDRIAVSEELEVHTVDAFDKLEKFVGNENVDFRTSYSKDGSQFKVQAHGHFSGVDYTASATSDDMYKSVDMLIEKLESQFRKEKSKRTTIDHNTDVADVEDEDGGFETEE